MSSFAPVAVMSLFNTKKEKQGNKEEISHTITVCSLYDWVTIIILKKKLKLSFLRKGHLSSCKLPQSFIYIYDCGKLYSSATLLQFNYWKRWDWDLAENLAAYSWENLVQSTIAQLFFLVFPVQQIVLLNRSVLQVIFYIKKRALQRALKNTAVSLQVKQLRPKSHQKHFFFILPPYKCILTGEIRFPTLIGWHCWKEAVVQG